MSPLGTGEVTGVIAQGNWNNLSGLGQSVSLVDSLGRAAGIRVSWTSQAEVVASTPQEAVIVEIENMPTGG